MKKNRLPSLIIDFKSKKMMKEFVKDAFLQSREHSVQDGEVEDEFLSEFEDELFDLDLP